jgi:hypothetical protein
MVHLGDAYGYIVRQNNIVKRNSRRKYYSSRRAHKMRKLRQQRDKILRVVTCGRPDSSQIKLIADDERILCYQRQQDNKWEPVYTQDERPFRVSLEISEVINRL